jgi:hypothetical protein
VRAYIQLAFAYSLSSKQFEQCAAEQQLDVTLVTQHVHTFLCHLRCVQICAAQVCVYTALMYRHACLMNTLDTTYTMQVTSLLRAPSTHYERYCMLPVASTAACRCTSALAQYTTLSASRCAAAFLLLLLLQLLLTVLRCTALLSKAVARSSAAATAATGARASSSGVVKPALYSARALCGGKSLLPKRASGSSSCLTP